MFSADIIIIALDVIWIVNDFYLFLDVQYVCTTYFAPNVLWYHRKVQLFWEVHKNLSNLPYGFDVY